MSETKKKNIIKPKFKIVNGKNIKIFDERLKKYYDIMPRKIVKKYLGDIVMDNPNIYNEDMIINDKYIKFKFIELQVFGKWKNIFPYEKPFIFERKMRFHNDTLFICFNQDYTKIIMFGKDKLNKEKVKHREYGEEYIYTIDWINTLSIDVDELSLFVIDNYIL
jgi:hypothetical protein